MSFMLSFTRGKPIALALDKNNETVFTIHVTPEEDEPDINVDSVHDLIDKADVEKLRQSMRIGRIELKLLQQALRVSGDQRDKLNLTEKLRSALAILEENATDKLKKEIDFTTDKEIDRIIPLIGAREVCFDRSVVLIGPSESGKTYLAKEICKFDRRKRPVVVFSKIEDDESLRELEQLRTPKDKKSRLIKIPLHTEDQLLSLPTNSDLNSTICIFDDLDSFPTDIANYMREYRNSILESGRHNNITVISTSHILNNYEKTKTVLNEAELVCLFPAANKRHAFQFLKDKMGLDRKEANFMISKSMKAGRMLCIKLSAPNLIIYTKGILLI